MIIEQNGKKGHKKKGNAFEQLLLFVIALNL